MIAGFYSPERLTRAAERNLVLSLAIASQDKLRGYLDRSFPVRVIDGKRTKAAQTVLDVGSFVDLAIKTISKEDPVNRNVAVKMFLLDHYNRFHSPFSKKDDVYEDIEQASKLDYRQALVVAQSIASGNGFYEQ